MPYQVRADGSPILANAGQSSLLEELRQRIIAGDPAARDELLRLARSEHTGSGPVSGQTLEVGQARKLANELLGTDLADLERSGGGFTALWFAAIGQTATSLATTDADGTTAVAQKAPRYIPLTLSSTLGATAALGTVSTEVGDHTWTFATPQVVHPGEFIAVGFRTIAVTAAVTAGSADAMIGINGYWD